MAGGGIRGGMTYGATDEFGHKAVENVVTPNDFQATVMRLFGLDHENLNFPHNSRFEIITHSRPAKVVTEIVS